MADRFPWGTPLTEDPDAGKTQSESMVPEKPDGPLKKYVVRCEVDLSDSRDSLGLSFSGFPKLAVGAEVESDCESWSSHGTLRVRIITPNVLFGYGYVTGWVNSMDLTPLNELGAPISTPTVISYAQSRAIQDGWEHGYRQVSVQQAISEAIAAGVKSGQSYRESCDTVWMHVRGPVLSRHGFEPTMAGLQHLCAHDRHSQPACAARP
jgi:hypothetical protein